MKKIKELKSLSVKSKKKKNFIIIWGILAIVGILLFSFVGSLLSVKKERIYNNSQINYKDLEVIKNPEYKENWAISMENRIKKQEQRMSEVIDLVKNQQSSVVSELKAVITENNDKLKTQLQLMKEANEFKVNELKKSLESKIAEQDERLANLKEILFDKIEETKNQNLEKDLIIGKNSNYKLPTQSKLVNNDSNISFSDLNKNIQNNIQEFTKDINETVKENTNLDILKDSNSTVRTDKDNDHKNDENITVKKRIKLSVINVDTSFNQKIIKVKNNQMKKHIKDNENKETKKTYHISTGFMKAYMITGAYAPVFEEGSMEPLPVLFEIDGSILMSNNVKGSLNKCYLLGSAKGKMNSETADIKLVSISCLTDGGNYRLEGSISGWVIGENGNPGLQGEMIHKNGAWLARTFVSGFFSTFSQALAGTNNAIPINIGGTDTNTNTTTSTTQAISSNFAQAGASGISDVFSKLGDYYLKMAEQIFPIIEVKPGRTVSILLIGGEDFELKENNTIDTEKMAENAMRVKAQKSSKSYNNAFTEAILNDEVESNSESQNVENSTDVGTAKDSAKSDTTDNFDFNF